MSGPHRLTRTTLLLVSALLTGCLPSSGPRVGGPLLAPDGGGVTLRESQIGTTYSVAVEGLRQEGDAHLLLLSARFRHVDPGLEVVGFHSMDAGRVESLEVVGDPRTRLPVEALGPLSRVTLDPGGPDWEPLVTLRPYRHGLLRASGLVLTYLAHGTTYEREVRGYLLGFEVTGAGRDSRDGVPVPTRAVGQTG